MAKKVLVGMSGGVDSAACVLLLQRQGYAVSGVTLRLHHYKDRPGTCGSADDIEEAGRVAAQMGISHRVLDLCDLFRREVMGHFVSEYCAGRTPNPCLDCNRELKFGAMLDWALDHGFDYVSTGHYARVGFDAASGRHLLLRGVDAHKDQSYVLYQMTQRQLAHLLLPVGEYSKPEIRALAADFGLENAQKPDSQDICFVPDGDYVRFLREFGGVTPEPGDFVDTSGRVLGRHRGLVAYTTGQRKGLGVSADRPLYVLSKDAKHNTVLLGDDAELFSSALLASRVSWIVTPPAEPLRVTAKTRYSQRERPATARPSSPPPCARCRTVRWKWNLMSRSAPSPRGRPWSFTAATLSPAARPSTRLYKNEKRSACVPSLKRAEPFLTYRSLTNQSSTKIMSSTSP